MFSPLAVFQFTFQVIFYLFIRVLEKDCNIFVVFFKLSFSSLSPVMKEKEEEKSSFVN